LCFSTCLKQGIRNFQVKLKEFFIFTSKHSDSIFPRSTGPSHDVLTRYSRADPQRLKVLTITLWFTLH